MIKIAIVEDESMYADQLADYLRQYEKENGEVFDITMYADGDEIVHKYGLKSIRYTAGKYDGAVDIDTKDNWFDLKILIPMSEKNTAKNIEI